MRKAAIRKYVREAEDAWRAIQFRMGWIDNDLKPTCAKLKAALEAIEKETKR